MQRARHQLPCARLSSGKLPPCRRSVNPPGQHEATAVPASELENKRREGSDTCQLTGPSEGRAGHESPGSPGLSSYQGAQRAAGSWHGMETTEKATSRLRLGLTSTCSGTDPTSRSVLTCTSAPVQDKLISLCPRSEILNFFRKATWFEQMEQLIKRSSSSGLLSDSRDRRRHRFLPPWVTPQPTPGQSR